MKRIGKIFVAGWLMVMAAQLSAAISSYEFNSDADRERFQSLTEELRCPKCQNNNIADSNAPIALDMRDRVHDMIGEGKSNQQIVDFMVDRYGDFVKYTPRKDSSTAVLWYGPVIVLLVGLIVVALLARRRSGRRDDTPDQVSQEVDEERLKKLLDKQ